MEKQMPKEFLKAVEILTKFIDDADKGGESGKPAAESEKTL